MIQTGTVVVVVILMMLASAGLGLLLVWLADRRDARHTAAEQTTVTRIDAAYARMADLIVESQRRQETHMLDVLNRFLSRSFEEFQYTRAVGEAIRVDQDDEVDHEEQLVRKATAEYVKQRTEELETAMAAASQGEDEV